MSGGTQHKEPIVSKCIYTSVYSSNLYMSICIRLLTELMNPFNRKVRILRHGELRPVSFTARWSGEHSSMNGLNLRLISSINI